MANWPENGTIGYGAEQRAFVELEHNSDGSHDLDTIGWTETAIIVKNMTDADAATSVVSTLSFQPRLVIFFATVGGTKAASWGADDGTTSALIKQSEAGNMSSATIFSTNLEPSSAAIQRGLITNLASNGFTITWTKIGSPTGTGTIIALCFK